MIKSLLILYALFISVCLQAQEKSIKILYEQTSLVYANIQNGEHLEALQKADEILGEYYHFPGSELYITYLYMYKAEAYLRMGDNMVSALCSRTARKLAEKSGDQALLFTIDNNLAALDIEKQDYTACFNKCRILLDRNKYKPDNNLYGAVLNNMTLSAFKTGNYQAADSLFEMLFEISKDSFPDNSFDRYLPYRNYGLYLMQKSQEDEAIIYFDKALQLYRQTYGENHFETLRSKLYFGDCLLKSGNHKSALALYNQVISTLDPDSLEIRPSEYEVLLIKSYLSRAGYWYTQKCQTNEVKKLECLKTSLEDLQKASDRISFMMQYYSAGDSGFTLAKIARPVCNLAVEVSLDLYNISLDEDYFIKALAYSNKAKRQSLFARNYSFRLMELSPSIEALSRSLYKTRQALARNIDNPEESTSADNTQEPLIDLIQEYSMGKVKLDSVYGFSPYNELEIHLTNEALKVFKRHPLISYHDQDSIFRVMVFRTKKYQEFSIKKSNELKKNIIDFKRLLSATRAGSYTGKDLNWFISLANNLYSILIEPIELVKPGQTLYIQPDGELLGLPFEILVSGDKISESSPPNRTFRELDYLFKERSIYYLSSIYTSEKMSIRGNEVLHFDGHAYISRKDYHETELESGLGWQQILSQETRGKSIYLNGCETGLGPYYSGEGLMSLGLAYLLSGARQVIENFWMVPDQASGLIANEFYKKGGFRNPASALGKAKLKYLRESTNGTDHPHYWAGTMIQGQPYKEKSRRGFFLIFLIIPVVILLIKRKWS